MLDRTMHRLFVALRPPVAIRDMLADTMEGVADARWQDDDQIHLTLRFIGAVESCVAEEIAAALAQLHAPAPVIAINGVGRFEKSGRTNTLWAAVSPRDAIMHLHRKVDQACVQAGLNPEQRAYCPHVTLARLPRSAGTSPAIDCWIADHAMLCSPAFQLPHLVLYESLLSRDGARYEALARWPLGTTGPAVGSHA